MDHDVFRHDHPAQDDLTGSVDGLDFCLGDLWRIIAEKRMSGDCVILEVAGGL